MRTTLREGEEVNYQILRHWIIMVKPFIIFAISIFAFIWMMLSETRFAHNFFFMSLCLMVFCGLLFWYSIAERNVDIWVVTNQRVIDETGLFNQKVKVSPLDKINNVECNQDIIGRMLGYGTVEIQTAAEQGATINQYVSKPKELRNAIDNMQERLRQSQYAGKRQDGKSHSLLHNEIECPYCAEIVKEKASICKHCHSRLGPQSVNPEVDSVAPPSTKQNSEKGEPAPPGASSLIDPRDWMG